jgi:hypothetical protein
MTTLEAAAVIAANLSTATTASAVEAAKEMLKRVARTRTTTLRNEHVGVCKEPAAGFNETRIHQALWCQRGSGSNAPLVTEFR